MDGKKSLIQKLGNAFEKVKSKLKYKPDEFYSDWFINNYAFLNATTGLTTSSNILKSSNSPFLPASQPQNLEDITLIWYEPRLNNTEDTKKTAEELREINNYVIFYSVQFECVEYIKSINNEKIFFITSGKASSEILPEIHELTQVDSIFIFCMKVDKYQGLLKKYEKIVGIYCERSDLIDSIKRNAEALQKQLDTFSFYDEHQEKATRDLSEESAEFLWFQLFKDVILQMSQDNQAKQQLVQFCCNYYRGNKKELGFIKEFEHHYKTDKSIYWYTRQTFLYKLVNKALRTEDIEQLYIFRFFIADLSLSLIRLFKKNHKREKLTMFYRGLRLKMDEINLLKQHEGNLISTNGFLSTSRSKDVALKFAKQTTKRTDVFPVLYEIECKANELESTIFVDITKYSEYATEQEVLFDLGSTFKILSVIEDKILSIHVIKLKATDAGIQMAKEYIELNRKEKKETSLVIMFGKLLIQMGKYDEALKYFQNLLIDSHGEDIGRIYNEIGAAYMLECEFDQAFKNFQRAFEIMMKSKPSRIKDSARPIANMASIFLQKGEYDKALDFYFQALEINKKFYGKNNLHTAITMSNIGNVYYKNQDYYRALMYHEKTLEIRQKELPNDHIDIAASFNNIGLIYWKRKQFIVAQDFYQKSLEIRKKLLPCDHHEIVQSLINIAYVLYDQSKVTSALKYYSEALTIQKIHFDPNNYDDLIDRLQENRRLQDEGRIGRTEHTVQLDYAPPNHDDWGQYVVRPEYTILCHRDSERIPPPVNNISLIHEIIESLNNYTNYQRPLELWEQELNRLLPQDLHELVQRLIHIAFELHSEGKQDTALKYYYAALTIQKIDFDPTNHYLLLKQLEEDYWHQKRAGVDRPEYTVDLSYGLPRDSNWRRDVAWPEYRIEVERWTTRTRMPISAHIISLIDEITEIISNYPDYPRRLNLWKQNLDKLPSERLHEIAENLINHAHRLCDKDEWNTALKYYSAALIVQEIDFDPNNHYDILKRLEDSYRLQNHGHVYRPEYAVTPYDGSSDDSNRQTYAVRSEYTIHVPHSTVPIRRSTSVDDVSCIDEIIAALKDYTNHQIVLDLWQQKLNKYDEFDENHPYVQGLLWIMSNTIKDFFPSDAIGREVFRFYDKALFILENSIPQLPDIENLKILCLDRIAYIHRQNNNFKLALDNFDKELKLQQQLQKSSTEIAITLRNIGVIHMNLKNYNLALTSFNDALKLFKLDSTETNDKEIVLTLKQIDAAKNALESSTKS